MVDTQKTLINYKWELNLLPFRATLPIWSFWEKERLAAMYTAIRPGDTIVDVGAEQGDMSALFLKWAGKDGRIVLIEPSPGFWPNIKATFEANNLVPYQAHQVLVSNAVESDWEPEPTLYPAVAEGEVSDNVGFSHLTEKPDIPVITIDSLNLDHIDVITMDIEGSEYEALQGAEHIIMRDKPALFISIHPAFMYNGHGHTSDDLIHMLDKWGYDNTFLGYDHESHHMFKARQC